MFSCHKFKHNRNSADLVLCDLLIFLNLSLIFLFALILIHQRPDYTASYENMCDKNVFS